MFNKTVLTVLVHACLAHACLQVVDLRPNWFMTNWLMSAGEAKASSQISWPVGPDTPPFAMVDPRDVAGAGVAILLADKPLLLQFLEAGSVEVRGGRAGCGENKCRVVRGKVGQGGGGVGVLGWVGGKVIETGGSWLASHCCSSSCRQAV